MAKSIFKNFHCGITDSGGWGGQKALPVSDTINS